ncbi:GT4 family glycosyltransferase PelF [Blautia sp.]|uniref:GT4 family glycosyltransferase PelF n=1 Tax=Blautia sp. TaxID=1955243 RepID=UPI003AB3B52F
MKVCLVAEGCYPYVVGGVSGWINSLIKSFPNIEFILLAIVANRSQRGKFVYELPKNLTQVYELYLDDCEWDEGRKTRKSRRKARLSRKEYEEVLNMVLNRKTDWGVVFDLFHHGGISVDSFLMGPDFFEIARECYNRQYPNIIFSDFLWTLRSIYLPLFWALKMDVPKADLYHCVATGYAGVLGSMAKHFHGSSLLISEHGIYTREREEELIKAQWVKGVYKNIWIEQFKKMSLLAYDKADAVTCLFERARTLQMELGCPEEKIQVTPNGIDVDGFADIPGKNPEEQMINIGAVLRVSPIKDVKTMIQAFAFAKKSVPKLKLWIMGPTDEDEKYAQECFDLVDSLGVSDIEFTGRVNVKEYLGRMDFTILTSISEGQPLTILESYAAHKPTIATDVGNCRELIYGNDDGFGAAGILTHIMNLEEIAQAMIDLAIDPEGREQMGEAGYKRVTSFYRIEQMKETYKEIYRRFAEEQQVEWTEEPFQLKR